MSEADLQRQIDELKARLNTLAGLGAPTLGEAASDNDILIGSQFISPSAAANSAIPTETAFTGTAMGGTGWTFGGVVYNFVAVAAGVLQAGFNSLGKFLAGAGTVILDASGIAIYGDSSAISEKLKFYSGTNLRGEIYLNSPTELAINANTQLNLIAPITVARKIITIDGLEVYGDTTVINSQSGNYDTTIKGDTDGELVFVDASADKVGISTNAPVELLDVDGTLGSGVHYLDEGSAPSTPASGKAAIYASTGSAIHAINDAGVDVNLFALPESALVFASEAVWSATGANSIAASSQRFNTVMRASGANSNDADTIDFSFVIKAGTYTLTVLAVKDNDAGILDGYLDGSGSTSWTGDDLYNASTSYNAAFAHSVTFATGGRHTLRLKVNGKNAASSDYRTYLTCVYLTPSAVSVEA